jgi:integrase
MEIVARRFVERYAKAHNKTWKEVQRKLDVNVLPHWGKRSIASITRRDVIALLDSVVDRGAAVEANRVLAAIRKFFNWAIERGLLETSPCAGIKPPTPESARDRVLDDRELALVWRGADALGYPFGPFVQLLILTGQRRAEVAGTMWSEIDVDLALWSLPPEPTKNGEPHAIPLAPWALAILTSLPRTCDFVLSTNGKTSISGYSKAKTSLDAAITNLNGAPLAPWTFHDIRRTLATRMAALGVQLPTVERLLNHTSGSFGGVAGVYQRHSYSTEMRQALETWAQHLLTLDLGSVVALRAAGARR